MNPAYERAKKLAKAGDVIALQKLTKELQETDPITSIMVGQLQPSALTNQLNGKR